MERHADKGQPVAKRTLIQNALVAAEIYAGVSPVSIVLPVLLLCAGNRFKTLLNRLRRPCSAVVREESGQDLIEYALLTALIALAVIAALQGVADPINSGFSSIHSKIHKHVGKHLGWEK